MPRKKPVDTIAQVTKVLYNAGLVQCAKMCRDVYYWIDREALDGAMCSVKGLARMNETA